MSKTPLYILCFPFLMSVLILSNFSTQAVWAAPLPPKNLRFVDLADNDFFPGDYSSHGIIGNSLLGSWRPFSDTSPWNTPIQATAVKHPESDKIIDFATSEASHIRFARSYVIPIWVVNSDNLPLLKVRSDVIFDWWDEDRDGWSDVGIPITTRLKNNHMKCPASVSWPMEHPPAPPLISGTYKIRGLGIQIRAADGRRVAAEALAFP
jgi:hypothetical protein